MPILEYWNILIIEMNIYYDIQAVYYDIQAVYYDIQAEFVIIYENDISH